MKRREARLGLAIWNARRSSGLYWHICIEILIINVRLRNIHVLRKYSFGGRMGGKSGFRFWFMGFIYVFIVLLQWCQAEAYRSLSPVETSASSVRPMSNYIHFLETVSRTAMQISHVIQCTGNGSCSSQHEIRRDIRSLPQPHHDLRN